MPTCSTWLKSIFLLAALWAPLIQAKTSWTPLQETIHKSDQDPRQYQAIRLDNGMVVLLVSDPQAVKSLSALVVAVGSLEDPDTHLGLAHYLEHMTLMGSRHYPQPDSLSEFLKMHGGSHNASTAPYRTAFYLEVENSALAPAVDRLADAIATPVLSPDYAERERNAVNAELTLARSRDGMRMAQVSAETLNPAHPASRFSGGNLETLRDKPGSKLHDALVAFHDKYYSAGLMKAVIYSNKPLAELAAIAARTYGRIPDKKIRRPVIDTPVVTEAQKGILIHYVPALPRKMVRIEFRIANNSAQFRSKTDELINYMIGNRSKDTLSDWLQTQGLADSVRADSDPVVTGNSGVMAISVSLTDKGLARRDEVVAAVFSYLNMLREKGIDKQYFDELAHVLDLDFRYPSITRDMDYVEWLADTMLRVPVAHTLDVVNIADRYDSKAIGERLAMMTPQNARIWYISPDEPHNKTAYFVNAPYATQKIPAATLEKWRQAAGQIQLQLPALNPYIPDDFTLTTPGKTYTHPELLVKEPGLRVLYMSGGRFADEPKADVTVVLRNPGAMNSAKNQVMFALNDYLAGLALDELSNQAAVGGISFSSNANSGLMINANGYTQHLPALLSALLQGYFSYTPTDAQLEQAKSWYLQMLDSAEKGKAYDQAIMPVQMLSQVPYYSRPERRALLPSITVADLLAYREKLKTGAKPEWLIVGNMGEQQARTMAADINAQLGTRGTEWCRNKDILVDKPRKVIFTRTGSSTDSALAAVFVPTGYDENTSNAYTALLGQIIQPWFYTRLRTEEQLGYAVFSFPMVIGRQWGLGFLLQSSDKQPAYLWARYQAFFPTVEQRLREMDEKTFARIRQAVIDQMQQPPQTLAQEAIRYSKDFDRANLRFDSRDKVIARLKQLTPAGVADFFHQAVIAQQGMAVLSQVSGSHNGKQEFAQPPGWEQAGDVGKLQQSMSLVRENQ
ncbi:pitrilysin [Shimwellia blattae]|uniref:Protease 3 n=1 Tax=Shimwellia blattae (strain ATCC 29907 / DSM 4481 / JCM 1650 / NBRC 105725 / CDC 9005-74) TaxID=630626 RepID=I2B5X8_SHIBC|nr:pitrilysin [Shimwellia blattae]AFJ45932.1 protease III precursor [Shimwellia blattae DSM 4481 = NBRC 105725]GAB81689.1 protease III [Shimwellia blattae DSM 4481 = NBRC 105725]VDY63408.1 Protease 3 precursor [Shimwellia blattae]VEC21274.1 Protease 3 precursor [Shimwellia blattae]